MTSAPVADPFSQPRPDRNFTRMVSQAHRYLAAVLQRGDLAVDLTAGNGGDTLFLFRCVGATGRVLAFDIQATALEGTRVRLAAADVEFHSVSRDHPADLSAPGVHLIHDSHAELERYLEQPPRGMIANLGYLPGGDPGVKTEPVSTLVALRTACARLASGGRIAVVLYVAHPGGAEESVQVERLFTELPSEKWQVLSLKAANRPEAPFLLVAEKR